MARNEIASFGAPANIGGTGASTRAGTVNAGNGGSAVSDTALPIIAPIVERIVGQVFGTDEAQLFCIQILSDREFTEPSVIARCAVYLEKDVGASSANAASGATPRSPWENREEMLAYLQALSVPDFETASAAIRGAVETICPPDAPRDACIAAIRALDDGNAQVVQAALAEQVRSRKSQP